MKKSARIFSDEAIEKILETIRDSIAVENGLPKVLAGGQHKVGDIPRFNLPPLWTCGRNCKHCKRQCYVLKDYVGPRKKSVAKSHARNYNAIVENLESVEYYLTMWIHKHQPRFFRIHASGDFFIPGLRDEALYAWMWYRVAQACPNTRFLAFTKAYDIVRAVPFHTLPNFSLVLSEWTDVLEAPEDLKKFYRTSRAVEKIEDIRPNEVECPGNCETCGLCWALKDLGHDVAFEIH